MSVNHFNSDIFPAQTFYHFHCDNDKYFKQTVSHSNTGMEIWGEINGDERQHIRKTADLRIKNSTHKKPNLNVRQTIFTGSI